MMDTQWMLTWILLLSRHFGECLRCFECDNRVNPACGVDFKSYQFDTVHCDGNMVKCGLQRQEPQPEKENFIGILRRCYHLGQLQNINESDGCHNVTAPHFTFEICFCSEDYCNATSPLMSVVIQFIICACLLTAFIVKTTNQRMRIDETASV